MYMGLRTTNWAGIGNTKPVAVYEEYKPRKKVQDGWVKSDREADILDREFAASRARYLASKVKVA